MTEAEKKKIAGLRYMCRTDLFWFAKEVLGMVDLDERVHRPVCETFVQKKPGLSIAQQDSNKERLILDGRGHLKTSLDIADAIQWIINFPNIRILIMSGKAEIAEAMLDQLKGVFTKNAKFRELFPEFCPPLNQIFGNTTEFTVPNRTDFSKKEPTVLVAGGESAKASFHFDVIKGDDLVNEVNSGTKDQIKKIIKLWNYTNPLVEPYGYRDLIGTRYDESDLYGFVLANVPKLVKFVRAAWSVKKEFENQVKAGKKITEQMVDVLWPERFTFEWLNNQRNLDPYIFNCQYLNDPTPTDTAIFTEEMLTSHIVPSRHIPTRGITFQFWDLAFSTKKGRDFTVGATGRYDNDGNLFILDLVVGRFTPADLVSAIVSSAIKWRPTQIGIEEAAGSRLIEPALDMAMSKFSSRLPIEWVPTSPTKHKEDVIGGLQPVLVGNKLYINAAIPNMEEVKKQFIKFPKYAHDDIPNAIAELLRYREVASAYRMPEQSEEEQEHQIYFDEDSSLLGAGLTG